MKRFITVILMMAMIFSLTACGGSEDATTAESTTVGVEDTESVSDADTESEENTEEQLVTLDDESAKEDLVSAIETDEALHDMLPDSIKESGVIKNGLDDAYPPMSYRTADNTLVGFDVDYGNAIAKKLGVEIEWIPTAFDGIITSIQSGQFDIGLSGFAITDEREEVVNFNEYLFGGATVVVRSEDAGTITSMDDLKGKTIGVQVGSSSEKTISEYSDITIQEYDTIPQEFLDLKNGRVDAVVEGIQMAGYYTALSTDYSTAFRINSYPWGIAFPKSEDGAKTQEAFKQAQEALEADGTFDKISQKWFGSDYNGGKLGFDN